VPVLILIVVGIETLRRRIAARRSRALLGFLIAVGVAYFLSSGWTGALVASSVASGASVAIMAIAVRTAITAVACLIGWRLVTAQDPRPVLAALLVALIVRAGFRSRAYSDAEGLWRDAAAKVPDNPRAYDNLAAAIIQKDSSRTGDAEQAFRAAIAIDSTYVTAWTNLADVELKRGRTTEGRALLERAIAINPDFVDANERLGGVLVKLGERGTGRIPDAHAKQQRRPAVEDLLRGTPLGKSVQHGAGARAFGDQLKDAIAVGLDEVPLRTGVRNDCFRRARAVEVFEQLDVRELELFEIRVAVAGLPGHCRLSPGSAQSRAHTSLRSLSIWKRTEPHRQLP